MKKIPDLISFRPSAADKLYLSALAYTMPSTKSLSRFLHLAILNLWLDSGLSESERLDVLKKMAGKDRELQAHVATLANASRKAARMDRENIVALLDQIAESMPAAREVVDKLKGNPVLA